MKFTKTLSALLLSLLVLLPTAVFAAGVNKSNTGLEVAANSAGLKDVCTGDAQECLVKVIGNMVGWAVGFVGIIFLVLIIYAGFLWMTAGGDDKKVGTARGLIVNAVIGSLIVVASYSIAEFVLTSFEQAVTNTVGSQDIPKPEEQKP